MGYEKEAYLYYLFHYTGKRFSRQHTKNPNANIQACTDVTFWLWDIIAPKSQLVFHIHYVKYENTRTFKRISWDSGGGGGDVLKIFFCFLYI